MMKMFIPLLCLISTALAEPPIGDSYASGHLNHEHEHNSDFQRSLSQKYGSPNARSFDTPLNSLPTEYGPPNVRIAAQNFKNGPQTYLPPSSLNGLSQEYGTPNARSQTANARSLSMVYGVPKARSQTSNFKSISSSYGVPNARSQFGSTHGSSTGYSTFNAKKSQIGSSRALSTEYGVPSSRSSPSQEYGVPSNSLSEEYGLPTSRVSDFSTTVSTEYGAPEFRTPSEEYGVPHESFGARTSAQKYGLPFSRNSPLSGNSLQDYSLPSTRNNERFTRPTINKNFSPSRSFKAHPSRSNSFLTAKNFNSDNFNSYTSAQGDRSDTYGVPNLRSLSQDYGVPSARSDKTSAFASSYTSARARSSPSQSYGVPLARDSMPSEEYGVPEQYESLSNQGYSYARHALDEALNQEPANYDFAYKVNDFETGSDFGHTESRQENRAEGAYFVVLPDGTKQVVEYEADERGFKPRISLEPVDLTRSGGYDENASDISRSADGPY